MWPIAPLLCRRQSRLPCCHQCARFELPSCTALLNTPPLLMQMFTTTGQASRVSIVKEIVIGASLGTALGFWWQT